MRRFLSLLLVFAWLSAAPVESTQHAGVAVLEPASTGGLERVDRALQRLTVHRRMLMIGAHPDDEDNTLMAYVARQLAGEAAYLSLSRGEGGQNLIGAELGEALGALRTGELDAARAVEGSRQFFTRAFDFGYTRSLDETLERWPPEQLAADVARVVDRFQPQVVVSIFPGDGRGRHGQHHAAGAVANALFEEGGPIPRIGPFVRPPLALYRRPWWAPGEADFELPLGAVDPHSGRSIRQLAAASRSRHRSQDMGSLQRLGTSVAGLQRVHGPSLRAPEGETGGLFDGIDTRLEAIADGLAEGALRDEVRRELAAIRTAAAAARDRLPVAAPGAVVDDLAGIYRRLREVGERLELSDTDDPAGTAAVRDRVTEKLELAGHGLLAAAGIALDATAERAALVAGEAATVELEVWSGGRSLVVESATLVAAPGWRVIDQPLLEDEATAASAEGVARRRWRVELDASVPPTVPYYLERPRRGALYDWSSTPESQRGEPASAPLLVAAVEIRVAGELVAVEREVVARHLDQAIGEVRRPLRVVPALELEVAPELLVAPVAAAGALELAVAVRSHAARPISGRLAFDLPAGWSTVGELDFEIADPRGRTLLPVEVVPAANAPTGRFELAVRAVADGAAFGAAYPLVDYPHVRPVPLVQPAHARVERLDLRLPRLGRVGYVRGAADRVPESLRRIGVAVDVIDGAKVADADLAAYDAIVIGSRAYETDAALREANPRLLRFAERGGLLIVQYQQYQFVDGAYAPYPLEIARPHGRVTDERSPYRLLASGHPVFHRPNAIGPADWRGWVQERGLYFADRWDEAYEPLLALTDDGQPEERGGLLVAPYGDGTYVYTGLSFFRQLPAGIPGAYRLFANLLGLADAPERGAEADRADQADQAENADKEVSR